MAKRHRPLRFALLGYYGCGNAGDEAVLAGIKAGFERIASNQVQLTVLSQNPRATSALHQLEAVNRMHLPSLQKALRSSDMLLCGGGSLLQDATSLRSLLYYLFVMILAQRLRKPVMFFAQGLGPLNRAISRRLVRIVANRAIFITVRDEESAQLLKKIGVSTPPIEVTADPAFCTKPTDAAKPLLKKMVENTKPLVGIALRPWGAPNEQPLEPYLQLLVVIENVCNAQPVLIPMQQPLDLDFAQQLAARHSAPVFAEATTPDLLLSAIAQMQAVVAMRLHALIFAVRTGVPPFALRYDQKIESQMRCFGLEPFIAHWRDFDPYQVATEIKRFLTQREAYCQKLTNIGLTMEQRALRNMEIALQVIGSG